MPGATWLRKNLGFGSFLASCSAGRQPLRPSNVPDTAGTAGLPDASGARMTDANPTRRVRQASRRE